MRTFKRLILEFWFPAVLAILWTGYNAFTATKPWDLRMVVNVFGPSFFLLSWATGQFFRVRKQNRVEESFEVIEQRLKLLLDTLDQRTQDLIGYATGSDAIVRFQAFFHVTNPHILMLSALNLSKYPVHDIHAEWIDLDEQIDPEKGKFWTRHQIVLPSLWPNKGITDVVRFDMTSRDRLRINIFVHTRNSGGTVQIRAIKAPDRLLIASKWQGPGENVERQVHPDFPGWDADNPDTVFN